MNRKHIPKPHDASTTDCLLVSFDTNGTDNSVMIVGRKNAGQDVTIVNAFQGKEAEELYKKLTTVKEAHNENQN